MQQVARYTRNHELRIKVNHSCNKLHATHEIMNYALKLIIRVTSCTLHTIWIYTHSVWFYSRLAGYNKKADLKKT